MSGSLVAIMILALALDSIDGFSDTAALVSLAT
jgi:hypothetical protein